MFFQELINYVVAWYRSRSAKSLLLLAGILAIIPLGIAGIVLYGFSIPTNKLAGQYLSAISEQMEAALSAEAKQESVELDAETQVRLKRILQMGNSNARVVYIVARELARQGRVATAAQKMREIAPAGGKGLVAAHAWLAQYRLLQPSHSQEQLKVLFDDLKVAEEGSTSLPPVLVETYTKFLVQAGQPKEALRILEFRAEQTPVLNFQLAKLARALNSRDDLKPALEKSWGVLETVYAGQEKDEAYYVKALELTELGGDFEAYFALAQTAYAEFPESEYMRRVCSNALLMQGKLDSRTQQLQGSNQAAKPSSGTPVLVASPEYLDKAFRMNPNNPSVIHEITNAIIQGQSVDDELREALEESLDKGTASDVTRLMLSNYHLQRGDPRAAVPQLERLVSKNPDAVIVLNNLAIAYLEQEPAEIDKASQFIDRALSVPNIPQGFLASMYDTQGQVRSAKGDWVGAIESYERAIDLDKAKLNSRKKLAEAYENAGMVDLATSQRAKIAELQRSGR